jgi:hypothetical protein
MRCLIMVPDIDAKDDYTAVMKNYSIAEILLGRRAKVNVLDNYRQTPLVSVVRTTRPDSTVNEYIITVVVQLLLDYGANPVLMDFAGRTAQDLAELSRLGLTVDLLRLRTPDSNRCRHCGKKTNTRRCTGLQTCRVGFVHSSSMHSYKLTHSFEYRYCSKDCQIANWPIHRRDCKRAQKEHAREK